MKKQLLSFLFIFYSICTYSQIGIGTSMPDTSAMLELKSENKGLLPTRIALSANNIAAPVHKPATGLLIYNTSTSGTGTSSVSPGYYYWNSAQWYPLINKGTNVGDMQFWNGQTWSNIPIGENGTLLTVEGGQPKWQAFQSPEEILTALTWRMEEIRFLQNNTQYYYKRGTTGDVVGMETESITFNKDNTGTYKAGSNTYSLTWEFLNASKTELSYVVAYPSPLTVRWENIKYTKESLEYTEYYNRSGTNTLSAAKRMH